MRRYKLTNKKFNKSKLKSEKERYISTAEFVNKFPEKIRDLTAYYALPESPKISGRLFRLYIAKGLMPKPCSCNRKAYYSNSLGMYRMLFVVWYLRHFRRTSDKEILTFFKKKGELKQIALLLDQDKFLHKILKAGNLATALRYSEYLYEEEIDYAYPIWVGIEYVHKIIKRFLKRDIERLRGNIKDTFTPPLDENEKIYVRNRIKWYKKIVGEINKAFYEAKRLRIGI